MDNHLKIREQNKKKLWFGPLQQCLSANLPFHLNAQLTSDSLNYKQIL